MVSLDEISQMSANSSSTTVMSLHKAAEDYESAVLQNIQPIMYSTFSRMWKECLGQARQTNRISRRLAMYQSLLTKIPNWSTLMLEEISSRIQKEDMETLV